MSIFSSLSEGTAHLSTAKAAAAGGTGGAVAIFAAMIDPGVAEMWLRIATLVVGLVTGLGSGALVYLKLRQSLKSPRHPQ